MALIESTVCLYCLNPSTARVGLDKKGRPFVHCIGCGARSFLPSFSPCLNGIAVLTPLARAMLDEVARDRAAWERHHGQISMLIATLRAQMQSAPAAGVTSAANTPALQSLVPLIAGAR